MMIDDISWLWNNQVTKGAINLPSYLAGSFKHSQPVQEKTSEVVYQMIIPEYTKWFVRIAAISGATAVALGAYGAHVFYRRETSEELKQVYETGNRYHFMHTLALLSVPLCKRPKIAGPLLAAGTFIFSGSCYYFALTGSRNVRQYTPYGGMLLIFGWLAMAF